MMGRIGRYFIGGAALVVLATFGLPRLSAVEDMLFDRALEKKMGGPKVDLFDGDGLKVFFCGTGSPLPSKRRAQICTAVFAGDKFFLVDAGTGSWENIQRAGIPGGKLAGIFLTHFHSDHIGDLSEANLGSWVGGRPAPLAVFGPFGLGAVVDGENTALQLDASYRTAHHGPDIAAPETAGLSALPFSAETAVVVYENDGLKVTAFEVNHAPVDGAVGYRFEFKGRSVVISGDTAYSASLVANAKGADLLIHEAQANHMVAKLEKAAASAGATATAKIFADIPTYHTTPEEAARVANEAGAKELVLTHLTPAPDNGVARRIFLRGVSKVRPGHVRLAEDGMLVELPDKGGFEISRL
jgi:ribonuclease Z